MPRTPIPTWVFALVVVHKNDRFLVVQENKEGQEWFLPAGRVEPGETLSEAAHRETLEEAGIRIHLEGILRVEYTPSVGGTARLRIIFVARPADDTPPKSIPDEESLQALWVTLEELDELPLRSAEVRTLFRAVRKGTPLAPLALLGAE